MTDHRSRRLTARMPKTVLIKP